jgi:hypothetical protein
MRSNAILLSGKARGPFDHLELLFLCFVIAAPCFGQGLLTGQVVDLEGKPIQGAEVHASRQGVVFASAIRFVTTDENGNFAIDRLEYGKY